MTQAAGQASGKCSRGLNHVLRPNVKSPSLFVYLPPSFTGWLHCSEWRHVEKAKKEGREEFKRRKKKGDEMKKLVGAVLTSLTAGRKCSAASRGGAKKESCPQMQRITHCMWSLFLPYNVGMYNLLKRQLGKRSKYIISSLFVKKNLECV